METPALEALSIILCSVEEVDGEFVDYCGSEYVRHAFWERFDAAVITWSMGAWANGCCYESARSRVAGLVA